MLLVLALVFVCPITDQTDSAEAEAIVSNTAISIATGRSLASVDITPTSSDGNFEHTDNTSNIAFTVTTDNLTGYSLLLSGNDATGALTNAAYSDTLASISSAINETTFETGSGYTNKWGIKPDMVNSASNTNYLPAPTTSSSITINETNAKNTTPDSYEIDLGARVDYIKAVGTYTNTFILQATSKPVLYEIDYLDTTGDSTVNNLPSNDTGDVTNISGYKLSTGTPTRTGYTFLNWCEGTVTHNNGSNSTCSGTTYAAGANYTLATPSSIVKTIVELKAMWKPNTYTINLTNTNATTAGSTSTTATFNSSSLTSITNPQRKYNITGFSLPSGNNANGASVTYSTTASDNCTSASACTNTYSFNGWYTATSNGTRIITSGKALVASTSFTNSSSQWTSTSGTTLYAQWANGTTKLPKITKEGYTCGWTTTSTGATSIQYNSEYTGLHPTSNTTLYGVCTINKYDLTIAFGNSYVTSVSVRTGSTSGTVVKTINSSDSNKKVTGLTYGTTYYLTATYSSTYRYSTSSKTSGAGTLSWPNFTVGAGNATVSVSGRATTFDDAYAAAGKSKDTTGYYKMQDMTTAICNAVTLNQTTTLTDSRVNGSYASRLNYKIVKLPNGGNGKCWMADNMYLDISNSTVKNAMTTSNTHADSTSLNALKNGGGTGRYARTAVSSSWTTNDSTINPLIKVSGVNCDASINSQWPCQPNGSTGMNYNTVALQSSDYGISSNKLGIFYNYCAASAGNYCYTESGTGAPPANTNATSDICPYNWRLPTGGSSGDFQILANNITNRTATNSSSLQYRLSTPLAGSYWGNSAWNMGYSGEFWSSTYSSASDMYFLHTTRTAVSPQDHYNRPHGSSVRCISQ